MAPQLLVYTRPLELRLPEDRPERGLADVSRRLVPDQVQALRQPDRRGRLALAERRRRDGRDHDVAAARTFRLQPRDRLEGHLGLGRTVELQLVVQDAQTGRDLDDRAGPHGAGDLGDRTGSSSVSFGRHGS